MNIDEELLEILNGLSHIMRFRMDKVSGQKRILMILNQKGIITQRSLTQLLGVQPGSVSEILEKMEETELIYRKTSESDRRTADIFLTEKGKALSGEVIQNYKREQDRLFSSLDEKQRETLLELLKKLYADWDELYLKQSEKKKLKGRGPHKGHGHHHRFKGHKKHHRFKN